MSSTSDSAACQGLFLIGAATMVAEIGWARDLGVVLGSDHEGIAVAVGTCLLGAGAGAWMARRSRGSTRALLACAAIAMPLVAIWCQRILPELTDGWQALASTPMKCLVAAPLLLAVMPLGAAAPLWFRSQDTDESSSVRRIARWLCFLDLGAGAGSILMPLFLLPLLGPAISELLAAAMIAVASGLAPRGPGAARVSPLAPRNPTSRDTRQAVLLAVVAAAIGIALQVLWCRLLGEVLGTSLLVLGFAAGMQLAGAALGSRAIPAILHRASSSAALAVTGVLWATAQALSALALAWLPLLYLFLVGGLGADGIAVPAIKVVLAALVMFPPSLAAGAFFALLVCRVGSRDDTERGATNLLFAGNLIGGAGGALAQGLVVAPLFGSGRALFVLAAITATGGSLLLATVPRPERRRAGMAAAALLVIACGLAECGRRAWDRALLGAGVFQWSREEILEGSALRGWLARDVVYNREGRLSRVMIERSLEQNTAYLRVGGRVEGSAPLDPLTGHMADLPTQFLLAVLPVLIRGEGRETLIIGLGGGSTAAAAVEARTGRTTVLEVEPAVVAALRSPAGVECFPWETARLFPAHGGGPEVVIAEARGFLHRDAKRWEAIVCQPSEPWLPWAAPLFTAEFFRLVRSRLTTDGIAVHWLQLHRIDEREFTAILAAFRDAFPHVQVFYPPQTGEVLLAGSGLPLAAPDAPIRWQSLGIQAIRARLGWKSVAPPSPLLDGEGVDRWLAGRARTAGELRATLEFRLPLVLDRGEDHTLEILESLRASAGAGDRSGGLERH